MIEWALAIIFAIAALLLILTLFKFKQTSIKEQQEADTMFFTLMNEIKDLKKQVRDLELDMEIITQEAEGNSLSTNERLELREIIDLYRRGYSIQSIATEKQKEINEVERLLAPYKPLKKERGKVKNAS